MIIDEYLVKLGVVADASKAKEFRESLTSTVTAITGAVAAIGAAVGALGAYFADAVGDLDELGDMAKNTGTSVAFLQQFGYAAEQTGSSVEAARQSVQGLSRIMGEAMNGVGRGAKMMDKFGISVKNSDGSMRDMGDVVGQIQAKMQGMNAQQQGSFLGKLGIDASMRQTLALTTEEFKALTDAADAWGTNTDEQAEAASKIDNRFKDLRYGMSQFRTLIGLSLIPAMDRMIGSFKEWFKVNREMVQGGLTKMFTILSYVIQIGTNFVGFMGGWRNTILLLIGIYALLNRELITNAALMLANPTTWIVAGIVAGIAILLLLIDDLRTYMQGGNSLFASFWGPFLDGVQEAYRYIVQFWALVVQLGEVFAPVGQILALIFGDVLVSALEILSSTASAVFGLILDLMHGLVAFAQGDMTGFAQAFIDAFNKIKDWATTIFGSLDKLIDNTVGRAIAVVKTVFSGGSDKAAVDAARNAVDVANRGAQSPQALLARGNSVLNTGSSGTPSSTGAALGLQQNININIQSTDPGAAGRAAAAALGSTTRTATGNASQTVTQ